MAGDQPENPLPVEGALHEADRGRGGEARQIPTLNAPLLHHLGEIFKLHADNNDESWHTEQLKTFMVHVQGESEAAVPTDLLAKPTVDFNGFLRYMTSTASNVMAPLPAQDLSWPLSSYFISSSHNTYLTGNQLYSVSSTYAYKNVLLRGCRCIEIDVWDGREEQSDSGTSSDDDDDSSDAQKLEKRRDTVKKVTEKIPASLTSRLEKTSLGKRLEKYVEKKIQTTSGSTSPAAGLVDDKKATSEGPAELAKKSSKTRLSTEPRVLHGYTLTKEVSFRDVCVAIRDNAFAVSDLPLIVSLEVHCGPQQQELMVKIMEESWQGLLLPQPQKEVDALPPPGELLRKILVKVKYVPPTKDATPSPKPETETGGMPLEEETLLPPEVAAKKAKKPSKIIQALSRLGIYTRGVSFKSLSQPEATMPTHVFSLSEKGVLEVQEKSGPALFAHNKHFFMRAYPSGLRITSSNLDPAVFWRKGIQICALNWRKPMNILPSFTCADPRTS